MAVPVANVHTNVQTITIMQREREKLQLNKRASKAWMLAGADLAARDLAEHFEQVRAPGGARSHSGVLLTT